MKRINAALLAMLFLFSFILGACSEQPPDIQIEFAFEGKEVIYDRTVHTLAVTDLTEGATVSYTVDGEPFTGAQEIGTYEITATAKLNKKEVSKQATLEIKASSSWTKPGVPGNISISTFYKKLTWNNVTNNYGYIVSVNGNELETDTNSLDLYNFEPGNYEFKIKTAGFHSSVNSNYSSSVNCVLIANNVNEEFAAKYATFTKNIATMRIETAGSAPIVSKVNYLNAVIDIESENPDYRLDDWAVEIRGRGNSTWDMEKKPYRIKAKSKTSIFGFAAVKNWALVANHSDKSFMRNYFAFMLGRSLDGMLFTPNSIYTELYLNGAYQGLYTLCDQMESGASRVDVEKYTLDNDGNLIDTGFMLEIDDRAAQEEGALLDRDYFIINSNAGVGNGQYKFALKYPKYDDYSNKELEKNPNLHSQVVQYIKSYIQETVIAIESVSDPGNYEKFKSLCDEQSFIDYFIVQELMKNTDAHFLSIFVNKKIDGKLFMGPLWDFDIGAGNTYYIREVWGGNENSDDPANNSPRDWYVRRINPWFKRLMNNLNNGVDFYENFKNRYNSIYETNILPAIATLDMIEKDIAGAAARNFAKWNILGKDVWPNPPEVVALKTFAGQVNYLRVFLTERALWLKNDLNKAVRPSKYW